MHKILVSSFACDPSKGSEHSYGWNWSLGLAQKGFEVHCLTRRVGKPEIEKMQPNPNLYFHYVALPFKLEKLYGLSTPTMYLYYILWQWWAYRTARELSKSNKFELSHHVSWGSPQQGSFMYKLKIPLIFGPTGGGQEAPVAFKKYFLQYWANEEKRRKASALMLRFNPASKNMLRKAHTILVSNTETFEMVKSAGATNIHFSLDAALPDSFFPPEQIIKKNEQGKLHMLWIGRFLPRKGLLLLLDVMNELKDYKDISLTVVGDGEMRDAFTNKIKEYGLHETVIWKGKVPYEEVKKYYQEFEVFFFTSLRDSCPVQCIEAMAYGMPLITLNLHGQGVIVNDETGIRCGTETPEIAIAELKNAILKLAHDPQLVAQMSDAAFKFASQQKWEEKIGAIVDKYYPEI